MSKFKTIEPKPGVIILPIKVPEGARDFKVFNDERPYLSFFDGYLTPRIYLSVGKYIAMGISTELTEEQCAELVETSEYYDPHQQPYAIPCYKGYVDNYWKWSAKESFASLMQSEGLYSENPYGEKPTETFNHPDWEFTRAKWQEAEVNTGKYLILKLVE